MFLIVGFDTYEVDPDMLKDVSMNQRTPFLLFTVSDIPYQKDDQMLTVYELEDSFH